MKVKLAFGKQGLPLELPEGFRYRVLEARSGQPLADAAAEVEKALDAPIGRPPLVEMARGKRWPFLDRLRGDADPPALFRTVPGMGAQTVGFSKTGQHGAARHRRTCDSSKQAAHATNNPTQKSGSWSGNTSPTRVGRGVCSTPLAKRRSG